MTLAVIAITLALPTLLYVLVANVESATINWKGRAQISLFLKLQTGSEQAAAIADTLAKRKDVERTVVITADQALAEFKEMSGFGQALDALTSNPLPSSIIVYLSPGLEDAAKLEQLREELAALPEVDIAQADLEWIQRLDALLTFTERSVLVVSALLALAVLATVSNTIRLAILNRRDEIVIIKLIGGTDQFIRRPFLYSGFLQGTLGAIVAWLLVVLIVEAVEAPVRRLAAAYGSAFELSGLGWEGLGVLVVIGSGLGWLASRWSVGRHLSGVEPV